MINRVFYIWIVVSVMLIMFAFINIGDRIFLPAIVFICFTSIVLTYYKTRKLKHIAQILLASCIFSVLSVLCLFDNYVSSRIEDQDGLSISNSLSYLYIGEDGWTKELFRNTYEQSLLVAELLFVVYIIVLFLGILQERAET